MIFEVWYQPVLVWYIFHDDNLAFVKWHVAFKHFSVVLRGRRNMHRNQEKNNELAEFQSLISYSLPLARFIIEASHNSILHLSWSLQKTNLEILRTTRNLKSLSFPFSDNISVLIQIYYQNIQLEILYNFIKLKIANFQQIGITLLQL